MPASGSGELEQIEVELLLEGIHRRYGYDLSGYSADAVQRPIRNMILDERVDNVAGLLDRVLRSPDCMQRLLHRICDTRPEVFQDPSFYLTVRKRIVPLLRTYPSVRIWVAGCASGEEAYSLAILLREERLEDRASIFATDLDEGMLSRARSGKFPLRHAQAYARDYHRAGGQLRFEDYYTARGPEGIFDPALAASMVFATHFPVTDGPFNEFHLILCRGSWPRFGRELQQRVADVMHRSLALLGFLALGRGELIDVSPHAACYEPYSPEDRIYRRMR
jgi:chemotaxis protein methyltransferase CheR